ncbi:MAG: transglutaminase family protein [Acidobacteriota bacterium]|nr:transglutaminase family protein [Acidobacteriota bacterium]
MYYSIRHVTRFRYSAPIYESMMEVRMYPRSEDAQRSYSFELAVQPRARVSSYRDSLGNTVQYFDIPDNHRELAITAEALVGLDSVPFPDRLEDGDWKFLTSDQISSEAYEMLLPSHFARPGPLLNELAARIGAERRGDPLSLVKELNEAMYRAFEYKPKATRVDSPIEDALAAKQGVCQDFAHVFITILRGLGIPARYVSGYLYQSGDQTERSREGATHAWVETWLPGTGWIGFDPTNNLLASDRHIRTAIGRDYADVPPTRGVFKGEASSKLTVSVTVRPSEILPPGHELVPELVTEEIIGAPKSDRQHEQAQQQQ